MSLTIFEPQPIVADPIERSRVSEITRLPPDNVHLEAKLIGPHGQEIAVPESLSRVLLEAARLLISGDAITIVPIDKELTTQEAAAFLNMSRQYLVQLLERGEIPFSKIGTHRRVRFGDLAAYKQARRAQRHQVLDEMTQLGQDMGDYTSSE